ncbi:hypothetical protein ACOMHN_064007 [Nucella lapillus]
MPNILTGPHFYFRPLWDGQKISDTNPEKPPANGPKSSEKYSLWSPPTHSSLEDSPRGVPLPSSYVWRHCPTPL